MKYDFVRYITITLLNTPDTNKMFFSIDWSHSTANKYNIPNEYYLHSHSFWRGKNGNHVRTFHMLTHLIWFVNSSLLLSVVYERKCIYTQTKIRYTAIRCFVVRYSSIGVGRFRLYDFSHSSCISTSRMSNILWWRNFHGKSHSWLSFDPIAIHGNYL